MGLFTINKNQGGVRMGTASSRGGVVERHESSMRGSAAKRPITGGKSHHAGVVHAKGRSVDPYRAGYLENLSMESQEPGETTSAGHMPMRVSGKKNLAALALQAAQSRAMKGR